MHSEPPPATGGVFDPAEVLSRLSSGSRKERLVHVHEVPARQEQVAPWPDWVAPALYSALSMSGITALWSHQREAADLAHDGSHVVISTGTASGKSIGFLLPVLEVSAKYLRPAVYDDTLTIVTTLREKPLLRIRLDYEVRRGDELLATGHTVHAFVDRSGRPVRPPAEVVAAMATAFG